MNLTISDEMKKEVKKIDELLGFDGPYNLAHHGLKVLFMSAACKTGGMADMLQKVIKDGGFEQMPQYIQIMNAFQALQLIIMSLPEDDEHEPPTETND